jgi:hypothetical protein
MKRGRRFLSAALAVGVVAVMPAAAMAAPSKPHHPRAKSAGSGPPPVIPSIVQVRITRGTAALARAADYVDRDMPTKAIASLLNARRNMYAAWTGARYFIEHAPPPPATDARVHRGKKAHASGGAVAPGNIYADAPTTAFAALEYQHTVATAAFGLLDGAKGTLRDAVSTTMFAALNRRDSAIAYIHTIPPPVVDAAVHRRAHSSGTAVVTNDFGAVMPGVIPDLDDEMIQIEGIVNGGAVTSGEKRILNQADFQVFKTEQTVNAFWPPVPADA